MTISVFRHSAVTQAELPEDLVMRCALASLNCGVRGSLFRRGGFVFKGCIRGRTRNRTVLISNGYSNCSQKSAKDKPKCAEPCEVS